MMSSSPDRAELDAVFISDLHLHPQDAAISERFNRFIDWAATRTKSLYILGDFFHVWPGDDSLDEWSRGIAARLAWLTEQGVTVWFMHGNRDFLIGRAFAKLANIRLITDPCVVSLGDMPVLLSHGDRYCTHDRAHQRLRKLTRNRLFPPLFLAIPYRLRLRLVAGVRNRSRNNRYDPVAMDVVPEVLLRHMQACGVKTLIHGHTHRQGLTIHQHQGASFHRYVLSDWDDNPRVLCYHRSKGLYFIQISSAEGEQHE